jgi:hypothetical protein
MGSEMVKRIWMMGSRGKPIRLINVECIQGSLKSGIFKDLITPLGKRMKLLKL